MNNLSSHYVCLHHRGLITISGADAASFLQNIVSNDIDLLKTHPFIHACLLTPQGKFLHDFYVTKSDGKFILDCEGAERTQDLVKRLSLYKLRANITMTTEDNVTIYVTASTRSTNKPNTQEISFTQWDKTRIENASPDGSRDAEIGISTLAELNLDETAVSYTKGCYIGQELVARMHNRNLGKKHLVAARFLTTPPSSGSEIENTGIMRSSCANVGLILMNREREAELKGQQNNDSEIYILGL
ncbi:MAG: folate-binding protein YgfZ [Alphaproteobacteria bacterium]|jgi:folate-binding protein YgfZ|nr:folate-binding protein YgfZ [Alphaproteobacteria bacterium]